MDYSIEERHRNEVLYLHSLYRQGPPVSNPNPYPPSQILNPNPNPYPFFNPNPPIHILNPNPNPIPPTTQFPNPNSYCTIPSFTSEIRVPRNPNPSNLIHNFRKLSVSTQFEICAPRNPNPTNLIHNFCKFSVSTQFKKQKKKKRGKKERKKWPPVPISDKEWPCNPIPEQESSSGWPTLNLKPNRVIREASAEMKAKIYAKLSQEKAMNAATEMFRKNMDSDGEVEDDEEDIMADDDGDIVDDDGCEEYKFFLDVFMGDSELRGYYEKNYGSGEFFCLVCAGIGQKIGKKFKDCVALVQHSVAIAKTKKRQAHRALGKVICKVLGWDIEKLPSINLPKLEEGNATQENVNSGNLVNINNGEVVQEKNDTATEVFRDNAGSELMVCEHSLMVSDSNRSVDNLNNGTPSTA